MNNNGFIIKNIKIRNFRGYEEQEFNFLNGDGDGSNFILLGGPNGYGKSSLIDAVEWCLTGNIRRLHDDYRLRKETTKNMQNCLIRHNGTVDDVKVTIEAFSSNKPIKIVREFSKNLDEEKCFEPDKSLLKIIKGPIANATESDEIFDLSIFNLFYDRHICSYEKNIRVYEKSRDDIYEMFSSFFGGTKEIETIINNLDGYVQGIGKNGKKVKGLIEELEDRIEKNYKITLGTTKEKLDEALKKLQEAMENTHQKGDISTIVNQYPTNKEYQEELSPHSILSNEQEYQLILDSLNKQEKLLMDIKFLKEKHKTYNYSHTYITHLRRNIQLSEFVNKIELPYFELKESIENIRGKQRSTVDSGLLENQGILRQIHDNNATTKVGMDQLLALSEKLLAENDYQLQNFYRVNETLMELENTNAQLNAYKSTDPALAALRSLIDHAEGFDRIKKDDQRECPLCGSAEAFSDKDKMLVQTARNILGEVDGKRAQIQKTVKELNDKVLSSFMTFKDYLLSIANKEINAYMKMISDYEATAIFKQRCISFEMDIDTISDEVLQKAKELLQKDIIDEVALSDIETRILNGLSNEQNELQFLTRESESTIAMLRNEFFELDFRRRIERLSIFIEVYDQKQGNLPVMIDLSSNLINDEIALKISILKEIQNNLANDKRIKDAREDVTAKQEQYDRQNELYQQKMAELSKAKSISNSLNRSRTDWDKQMADQIRKPLQKIYRRINRHTNIDSINLLIEGTKNSKAKLVANVGNKEISATNILSAGQLSVVALAIFLTVAMGQRDQMFKCYFMDDPIQTMDDLNVLSFIDLLRTELLQIEGQRFVDQLFFTTCNENLEKLVSHKMKSFGVRFTHFHFTGYGQFEVKA